MNQWHVCGHLLYDDLFRKKGPVRYLSLPGPDMRLLIPDWVLVTSKKRRKHRLSFVEH